MLTLSEPRIVERGPYKVVGVYGVFTGADERPRRDHPDAPEGEQACFVGVEVSDFDHAPDGMSTTQFSGGQYVIVESRGDTQDEAAMGVGEAIGFLAKWMSEHGYVEGDACFACSDEKAPRPPHVEQVYVKIEAARR